MNIISIDPGTKYWGITIIEDKQIILSIVKTFKTQVKEKQRLEEVRKVLSNFIKKYEINILIIEKPFSFWTKQSNYLNKIIEEIKNTAKANKLKIYQYSPRTVRYEVCNDGNANKEDLAKAIALKYREYRIYLNQNRKYKDIYWGRMFDSIALYLCYEKLEGNL